MPVRDVADAARGPAGRPATDARGPRALAGAARGAGYLVDREVLKIFVMNSNGIDYESVFRGPLCSHGKPV